MGVSHSMNHAQVDQVLTQFEATTDAIRGIERKVDRVDGYIITAKHQSETMTRQVEASTRIMDNLTLSMQSKSDVTMNYFTNTLDIFADIMESFEGFMAELGISDLPSEFQREMGPLLVPAIVLVLIVTVSNCVFGFMLAGDSGIQHDSFLGDAEGDASGEDAVNLLRLFAIFHICLIGVAFLYFAGEACRYVYRHRHHLKREVDEFFAEQEMADMELDVEQEDIDDVDQHSDMVNGDNNNHFTSGPPNGAHDSEDDGGSPLASPLPQWQHKVSARSHEFQSTHSESSPVRGLKRAGTKTSNSSSIDPGTPKSSQTHNSSVRPISNMIRRARETTEQYRYNAASATFQIDGKTPAFISKLTRSGTRLDESGKDDK